MLTRFRWTLLLALALAAFASGAKAQDLDPSDTPRFDLFRPTLPDAASSPEGSPAPEGAGAADSQPEPLADVAPSPKPAAGFVDDGLPVFRGVARLHMLVPRNAEVTINGRPTTSRGEHRLIELAGLAPHFKTSVKVGVELHCAASKPWSKSLQVSAGDELECKVRDCELLLPVSFSTLPYEPPGLFLPLPEPQDPAAEAPAPAGPAAVPDPPEPVGPALQPVPTAVAQAIELKVDLKPQSDAFAAKILYDDQNQLQARAIVFDGRVPLRGLAVVDNTAWPDEHERNVKLKLGLIAKAGMVAATLIPLPEIQGKIAAGEKELPIDGDDLRLQIQTLITSDKFVFPPAAAGKLFQSHEVTELLIGGTVIIGEDTPTEVEIKTPLKITIFP